MQPVVRCLRLLTMLADHPEGLGLQEIADLLELPVSTVHRLATILESERYLLRTSKGKRLLLGSAVRRLVASTSSEYVRSVAGPVMARLNRSTGETVYLAEQVGDDVICISIVPGTRPLRLFVQLGRSLPLHASAAARVILAHWPTRPSSHCSSLLSSPAGPTVRSPIDPGCLITLRSSASVAGISAMMRWIARCGPWPRRCSTSPARHAPHSRSSRHSQRRRARQNETHYAQQRSRPQPRSRPNLAPSVI